MIQKNVNIFPHSLELSPEMLTKSKRSFARLLPRLEKHFKNQVESADWELYIYRLNYQFDRLFGHLYQLYGHLYDFFYHLENLAMAMTEMWLQRPPELKALDAAREADPLWYQSNRMVGAMLYVDLFNQNLAGIKLKIPYFKELGITYLHLMPIFRSPEGDNDGGYAISDYRQVEERIGNMAELEELASELRYHGISLVLDFVFNHTSDEHEWARKALSGDAEFQEYYRMFPDRTMPDQYEKNINAVFPDEHQGSFTYRPRIKKWVWTTFHNFQWDLNYENPAVFISMAQEMLFLVNIGVEVLRLDAVAFLGKKLGTNCENLPEAHTIIQAFNAISRIVSPAIVFKSEAIVHPDEVNKYIDQNECQISYNPQLMALLWNTLATRDIGLLQHGLHKRFAIPTECAWVNYVRVHDDIGWAFSNEDMYELHMNAQEHRKFLKDFYIGVYKGSFASGLPFQENLITGDARISGTLASLTGLEKAIAENDVKEIDLAIKRILLLHGIILTIGGIPLIYLGDEIGQLNDYSFRDDPEKETDTRWVHRSFFRWDKAQERNDMESITGRIYLGIQRLIQIRKQNMAFNRSETEIMDTQNRHILGYFRQNDEQSVLVLANFSETEQSIPGKHLRLMGLRKIFTDIVSGQTKVASQKLTFEPYEFMVLVSTTFKK